MIYLYAIIDGLDDAGGIRGLEDEPIQIVQSGTLAIACGELRQVPSITRDALAAQDSTVKALHTRAAALLPMRFGVAYRSGEDARLALKMHADTLAIRLRSVRHREQMTLRVTARSRGEPAPIASGTDYLRARGTPSEIANLVAALRPLVHDTIVERGHAAAALATVYHLIDRGNSAAYGGAVETAAAQEASLTVYVSGPGPCYAFT